MLDLAFCAADLSCRFRRSDFLALTYYPVNIKSILFTYLDDLFFFLDCIFPEFSLARPVSCSEFLSFYLKC